MAKVVWGNLIVELFGLEKHWDSGETPRIFRSLKQSYVVFERPLSNSGRE